jgi:hypothetical protein
MAGGVSRNFTITGQCGIPASAVAVSFNFAVWNTLSFGDLKVYPTGSGVPAVSTINWNPGVLALANAAVVPLGTSGQITTVNESASPVDLFFDVNGFYGPTPADATQFFTLNTNSSNYTMRLNNASTTCSGTCGLYQTVQGGSAIEGDTYSSSATDVGVYGFSSHGFGVKGYISNTANGQAGVYGSDGAGAGSPSVVFSAGVRGDGQNGVLGYSNTSTGVGAYGIAASPASYGVYSVGNLGATGTKPFVEPHPTDPTLSIRYVALEGPEAGTYFRGTATTVDRRAVIEVPESFRIVSAEDGLTVQLTPVGQLAQMAVMSQDLNHVVVMSSRDNLTFHYQVNGIRRAYKDWEVVARSGEYRPVSPDTNMPTGLSEEAKARLIANGTYNADGTVNMSTAERVGWARAWREEAAAAAAHK